MKAWVGIWCCLGAFASVSTIARAATTDTPPSRAEPTREESASSVGAHHWFVAGKLMPGMTLRGGKGWFWVAFEGSFVFLTDPPPQRSAFVGNQLGGHFMLRPLATRVFELEAGVGVDFYPLWGIHGDEWQLALAARIAGHAKLYRNAGAFATARAYPLATHGLELGTHRDGSRGLPVLFGAGLEWWL